MKNYAYLDVIERALDSSQREVCFTTDNAVIAAGAGSGKTQVLATRFAWLVISKGIKASEILTLTFTDKAASEMYQRIYSTLKYFAEYKPKTDAELLDFFAKKRRVPNPTAEQIQEFRLAEEDLTEDKKKLAAAALDDFTNVHIQTLDSYCAGIVRQCANRYGIRPDFSAGTGDGEKDTKERAFSFALKYIDSPCVQEFSDAGKIQDFAENLLADAVIKHTSAATDSGYFMEQFQEQKRQIVEGWNQTFHAGGNMSFCDLLNEIQNAVESGKTKMTTEKALWTAKMTELIQKGLDFNSLYEPLLYEDFDSNPEKIMSTCNYMSEFFDILAKIPKKGYIKAARDLMKPLKEQYSVYFRAFSYFFNTYEKQVSLMELLDKFLDEVNASKRETGSLTFYDVTELALKVLVENEDIRNNEKNSYKKIMIDEFQDNNAKNRDLLYLLSLKKGEFESADGTCSIQYDRLNPSALHDMIASCREPDKLFFVGDEKQSIYKFRNADVSVFNSLTSENKQVFMNYNYRSTPELISAFNAFFENDRGIFIQGAGNTKDDYEAHYKEKALKNGVELPELTKENVPVHVRIVNENLLADDPETALDYIPKAEQEAYFIAESIYKTAQKEFKDIPRAEWPWNKFAILDKSRSKRSLITKYLGLFNIPFQVDQFKNIFEEGIVNDIYNFLRVCVYPSDVNAFTAFLCSPLAGLTQDSAEKILSCIAEPVADFASGQNFVFDPFTRAGDERLSTLLEPAEFSRFQSARAFYEESRKRVLSQELTETLSDLWNARGYRYETMLSEHAKLCAEHFDMIFELARTSDEAGKNLSWFIDELERLKKSSLKGSDSEIDTGSISYPLERNSAVQIMTIFKSKGLQFEHVYICGCVNIRNKNSMSPYLFFEDSGVSVKPTDGSDNYFKLKSKELENLKELAEFRRLIYVAITRAIKDVYIIGRIDSSDSSSKEFRLIHSMIEASYPDAFAKPDYALSLPVYVLGAAFDYQGIQPVRYADLPKSDDKTDSIRAKILSTFEANSLRIQPADPACHGLKHKQPSKLYMEKSAEKAGAGEEPVSSAPDQYENLSAILRKYGSAPDLDEEYKHNSENQEELRNSGFSATDFGTLVHDYLFRMASGVDIMQYQPVPEKKYFGSLNRQDKQEIISICIKMCTQFKETPVFKEFLSARAAGRLAKAEYEFKMFYENALFRGSVDLIYETEAGDYVIVDYKTDRNIIPSEHIEQQKCYMEAMKDIVPHPGKISCFLYYLRFNELVPLDISCEI